MMLLLLLLLLILPCCYWYLLLMIHCLLRWCTFTHTFTLLHFVTFVVVVGVYTLHLLLFPRCCCCCWLFTGSFVCSTFYYPRISVHHTYFGFATRLRTTHSLVTYTLRSHVCVLRASHLLRVTHYRHTHSCLFRAVLPVTTAHSPSLRTYVFHLPFTPFTTATTFRTRTLLHLTRFIAFLSLLLRLLPHYVYHAHTLPHYGCSLVLAWIQFGS